MLGTTMLRVVGQQCCVRLHGPLGMNSRTFKISSTRHWPEVKMCTRNNEAFTCETGILFFN